MNSNEEVSVYVLLNDIDSDAVMDSFAKSFKGEASEYMLAKEGDPEAAIFCLGVKSHCDEAVENGAKDAVDISAIERYNKVEGRSCK